MLKSNILYLCLVVLVGAELNENSESHSDEDTCPRFCVGAEYACIDGYCYCAAGFIPNLTHNRCVRCPGLGQRCYGRCCDTNGNLTLTCWKGYCTICQADEERNIWICPEHDNIFLLTSTEIAMGSALVLGIIATFLLIYKLCSAVKTLRPLGSSAPSRPSLGSLQLYVDERLRDAPPRYSRTAPSMPTILAPASSYLNAGFKAKLSDSPLQRNEHRIINTDSCGFHHHLNSMKVKELNLPSSAHLYNLKEYNYRST